MEWVQDHQLTSATPAPSGTFVWETLNKRPSSNSPHQLTEANFPPLVSQAQQAPLTSPPTPACSPRQAPQAPSASHLSSSNKHFKLEDMREFGRSLAIGIAQCFTSVVGATIETSALEKTVDTIVTKAVDQTFPPYLQSTSKKPRTRPRRIPERRRCASLPRKLTPIPAPRRTDPDPPPTDCTVQSPPPPPTD